MFQVLPPKSLGQHSASMTSPGGLPSCFGGAHWYKKDFFLFHLSVCFLSSSPCIPVKISADTSPAEHPLGGSLGLFSVAPSPVDSLSILLLSPTN